MNVKRINPRLIERRQSGGVILFGFVAPKNEGERLPGVQPIKNGDANRFQHWRRFVERQSNRQIFAAVNPDNIRRLERNVFAGLNKIKTA